MRICLKKLKKSKEKYYQPQIASKLEEKDKIAESLEKIYKHFPVLKDRGKNRWQGA